MGVEFKQIILFVYATSALIISGFCVIALSQLCADFIYSMNACVTSSQIKIKDDLTEMFLIATLMCYFLASMIRGIIGYNERRGSFK